MVFNKCYAYGLCKFVCVPYTHQWLCYSVPQDPNVKLIRELRSEIRRLKGIITAGGLVSSSMR